MARRGTRKSSIIKRRTQRGARLIEFARKFGVKLGIAIFILWVGSWIAIAGGFEKLGDWAERKMVTAAADRGFVLTDLMVEGRRYTDADTIKAIINIQKGEPLFSLKPPEARDMLERLSWVKTARVERRLPGTVYIYLEERQPLALWQRNKRISLVDEDGVVITDHKLQRFKDLIVITGKNAPQKAAPFITLLEAEPEIESRVEGATLVSDRRWNLQMDNGTLVKLPEKDVPLALRRLAKATEEGLLDKPLKSVDLRGPDHITVQTIPGAVKHFQAGYQKEDGAI